MNELMPWFEFYCDLMKGIADPNNFDLFKHLCFSNRYGVCYQITDLVDIIKRYNYPLRDRYKIDYIKEYDKRVITIKEMKYGKSFIFTLIDGIPFVVSDDNNVCKITTLDQLKELNYIINSIRQMVDEYNGARVQEELEKEELEKEERDKNYEIFSKLVSIDFGKYFCASCIRYSNDAFTIVKRDNLFYLFSPNCLFANRTKCGLPYGFYEIKNFEDNSGPEEINFINLREYDKYSSSWTIDYAYDKIINKKIFVIEIDRISPKDNLSKVLYIAKKCAKKESTFRFSDIAPGRNTVEYSIDIEHNKCAKLDEKYYIYRTYISIRENFKSRTQINSNLALDYDSKGNVLSCMYSAALIDRSIKNKQKAIDLANKDIQVILDNYGNIFNKGGIVK